jgi:hypothetical protein
MSLPITLIIDDPAPLINDRQSLFSNGRRTGLQALDEVCRRIHSTWNNRGQWITCSELATQIAAREF